MKNFCSLALGSLLLALSASAQVAPPDPRAPFIQIGNIISLTEKKTVVTRRASNSTWNPGCLRVVVDRMNPAGIIEFLDDLEIYEGDFLFGAQSSMVSRLERKPNLTYQIPTDGLFITGLQVQTKSGRTLEEMKKATLKEVEFVGLQLTLQCD